MTVRTRFAPSPTGYLHIGGVRTALFSWLYARHHAGTFVLRIEDTDRERSTPEAVDVILDGLRWLGLDWDEGPIYQSRRMDRYREVIDGMLTAGSAYHCYCSREELEAMRAEAMARGAKPKYNGRCRDGRVDPPAGVAPVVRFRNPADGEVVIDDLIQGRVVYRNSELDDLILARSDGSPTYNVTVVIDDMDMRISHVIRGDDHLNNTARQLNIFSALNASPPRYAHIPLILAANGRKLSKRSGTVSVLDYRDAGFLPEALLNYLVRLGWSHGDQEIFSLDEMIALFDITDVNKAAAAINEEKLLWLNQHYLKQADPERIGGMLVPQFRRLGLNTDGGPPLGALLDVQRGRVRTLKELAEQSRYFYEDFDEYDAPAARKHLAADVLEPLLAVREGLAELDAWQPDAIHAVMERVATAAGVKLGRVAQALRVAISGGAVSPSIDLTLWLTGRARVLARLDRALEFIRGLPPA